jgi:hypothetical protein
MPLVATPRRRRRSHRSVPFLLGLALLSVAAGAGRGHPAHVAAPVVAQTRVVSADLPARDTSLPAGFVASAGDAHTTSIVGVATIRTVETVRGMTARAGADRWGDHQAPLAVIRMVPAAGGPGKPTVGRVTPSRVDDLGTITGPISGSRGPPVA